MIKVRAKQTTLGEYGMLKKGQEAMVRPSVAKDLSTRGILEIIGEDDGEEPVETNIKGGVRIKDNATGETLMDSNKIITKDTRESVTGVKEPEKAEEKKKVDEKAEQEKKQVTHTEKKEYK